MLWARTRQFLRTCRIVLPNLILWQVEKHLFDKAHFLLETILCARGMQFWKPSTKFRQKPKIFHSNSENKCKTTRFLKIYHLSSKTRLTRSLHVWQPCRENLAKNLKSFLLEKKYEKRKKFRHFLNQKVPWPRRKQHWHSCWKFLPKLPWFYSIVVFSSKSYSAGIDCIFQRSPEEIHQILKSFPLKVRKKIGFMFLIEALLSSEKSSVHVKRSF